MPENGKFLKYFEGTGRFTSKVGIDHQNFGQHAYTSHKIYALAVVRMETFFCVLLLAQSRFQITFKKGKLPDFSLLFLSIKMTYSNTLVYCNNECCADLYLTLQDNCSSSRLVIICFYEIVNAMLLIRLVRLFSR